MEKVEVSVIDDEVEDKDDTSESDNVSDIEVIETAVAATALASAAAEMKAAEAAVNAKEDIEETKTWLENRLDQMQAEMLSMQTNLATSLDRMTEALTGLSIQSQHSAEIPTTTEPQPPVMEPHQNGEEESQEVATSPRSRRRKI